MLDKDKDTWISFYDFLAPLMPILPPEVATVFTQESRYKTQTFQEIRTAFNAVKYETDISMFQANVKTLALKLAEKPDPHGSILVRALEQGLTLIKHTEPEISQSVFRTMMARLEKRSFFTFVSKLYQREIKLNCDDAKEKPKEIANLY